MSYDTAITVFAPDGRLFQVDYAFEAARRGNSALGIRTANSIILGVEKISAAQLQDPRTIKKIIPIDQHITLSFAGLQADARIISNKAMLECQSYRLTLEDAPSIDYIARFVAKQQQRFTQKGGVRPYGVNILLAGFDREKRAKLYLTEPNGTFTHWKAVGIGKNEKSVNQLIESKWSDDLSEAEGVKLAVEALLGVVENGAKNIEVALMRPDKPLQFLPAEDVVAIVEEIEGGAK